MRDTRGVTLIALIITIIILLILAGISIASLTASGLFEKVKEAKEKSNNAQIQEEKYLEDYENSINEYIGDKENIVKETVKLVPILTSNTSGGGTAFATYTGNGRVAWEAFDGNIPPMPYGNVPGYVVAPATNNQIGYDFGEENSKLVNKIVYYGHPADANTRYTKIILQYSDNGIEWNDVETFYPIVISNYQEPKDLAQVFIVTSTVTSHRYWRIDGTNEGHSWSGLLELEFWGY